MINLYDLLEAANGQLFGEPGAHLFSEFCVDSRRAQENSLYVAVKTERGDGHQYMQEAVQRGATGLLCSRPPDFDTQGISVILVKSALTALMNWSHFTIGKQGLRVIAVAGVVGKSVALGAIERVLATRYPVLCATGEYPGRLDIPMTLARLTPDHQIVALILDATKPGEMGEMIGAVHPHVGVVAHMGFGITERFDSPEHLLREMSLLIESLSPTGLAVLNYDDDLARSLTMRARSKVLTVSTEEAFGPDMIAQNISLDAARTGFDLRFNDQRAVGKWTPLLGKHHLICGLAALAVGQYFDVPLADGLRVLTDLEPLAGRMKPLEGLNGCLLIDDSYRADGWSTLADLEWLRQVAAPNGRAIFVFGDMDSLGVHTQRSHRQVGQRASEFVNLFVTTGSDAALAARAALDQGMDSKLIKTTYSAHDAVASLKAAELNERDIVLVKGGAHTRLDLVVRELLNHPEDAAQLVRSSQPDLDGMAHPSRVSWVEIDLDALAGNVRGIKQLIGDQVTLFAVIKADAYGHGAVAVARTALQNGADYLAVANLQEALDLRDAGIIAPILMMSYLPPELTRQAIQQRITATIVDLDVARAYNAAAREAGGKLHAHVKIDTGMGRFGTLANGAVSFFRHTTKLTHLDIEGVYTHYSTSDDDPAWLAEQTRVFRDTLAPLRAAGFTFKYVHAANSAATLRGGDYHFNGVRVGLAMYGYSPSDQVALPEGNSPVMTWKTLVSQVKTLPAGHPVGYGNTYRAHGEERIAILPVGYADGFRRAPNRQSHVLVHGAYAPVIGRVSMDKTIINVSAIPDVSIGDEVVLLGRQGDNRISADDIASELGTNSYEVLCAVLPRISRR
jgi:alanine racemase